MSYIKTRLKIGPDESQTRYHMGRVDDIETDIIDERAHYSQFPRIVATEDAENVVVAIFEDGSVRITNYRRSDRDL